MVLTTDPRDPRLTHGIDENPVRQADVYLVLGPEEVAKGFTRPYRDSYRHTGSLGPEFDLRDLTQEETERYQRYGYTKYEDYPANRAPATGRFWTQRQLDAVGMGCGYVTTMGRMLSETYARDPKFYSATYCTHCQKHRPVEEFVWVSDGKVVGS